MGKETKPKTMEYWNSGIMGVKNKTTLFCFAQHSIIPSFQDSGWFIWVH
jgi:hypothetical protein